MNIPQKLEIHFHIILVFVIRIVTWTVYISFVEILLEKHKNKYECVFSNI